MIKEYHIENVPYFFDGETLSLYKDEIPEERGTRPNEVRNPKHLYSATFFMTDRCNGNCMYCYEEHGRRKMKKEDADRAIDTLKKSCMKIDRVSFFGGEPLLNFEVIKYIVERMSKEFLIEKWEITTNATLMDEEILNFLIQYQFRVVISLDGPDFIHNYLRPGCNHAEVLKWINAFKESAIKEQIEINCTYTQIHCEQIDLESLISYFVDLGVKYTISDVITDISKLKLKDQKLSYKEIIDKCYKNLIENSSNLGVSAFVSSVINAVVKRIYCNEFCTELSNGVAFNTDGEEYPCTKLIKKCRKNDKKLLESNSKNNEVCNKCWAKGLCSYCAANIYTGESIPYEASECELEKGYDYALQRFIEYLQTEPDKLQSIVDNYYS